VEEAGAMAAAAIAVDTAGMEAGTGAAADTTTAATTTIAGTATVTVLTAGITGRITITDRGITAIPDMDMVMGITTQPTLTAMPTRTAATVTRRALPLPARGDTWASTNSPSPTTLAGACKSCESTLDRRPKRLAFRLAT
jgi:hypothetical protein